jgi:hypothetical protein
MDIEGAEWDILPCVARNQYISSLIDTLYLEDHCPGGPGSLRALICEVIRNSKLKLLSTFEMTIHKYEDVY